MCWQPQNKVLWGRDVSSGQNCGSTRGSVGLLLPQRTAWDASSGEEAGVCPRSIPGFLSPVSARAVQIKTWSEGV